MDVVRWVATALGPAALAAYATTVGRASIDRQLRAEQARAALAEELAERDRRLAVAERLATVGRLAAGVAHEVNNALAFLRTNLEWLKEHARVGVPLPDDAADALADATHGVDRIARTVAELRGFSASTPDEPCGAPVDEVIAEALRVVAGRLDAGASVRVDVPAALPAARMCRGRLVQVIGNLAVNASDAVAGAPPPSRWIAIRAGASRGRVSIAVEDGGPGIPEHVRAHLFEPFFTTKPPGRGTGLGLALAREYVARAGGRVEARDRPGGGALFELDLPAATAEDAARCAGCTYRDTAVAPAAGGCPPARPRLGISAR